MAEQDWVNPLSPARPTTTPLTKAYILAKGSSGNEIPLLADESLVWELRKGIQPYKVILNTLPEYKKMVDRISGRGMVSLVIEGGGVDMKIDNLYILDYPAAQSPREFAFIVGDCRWLWERLWIISRYNVRRHIGFKRVEAPNAELAFVRQDIYYKKYSLKDPGQQFPKNVWTARDALEDVVKKLVKFEDDYSGYERPYTLPKKTKQLDDYPLEDFELDDMGHNALGLLMSKLPMVSMYIEKSGTIKFYNQVSGKDEDMVRKLGPEIFQSGHIERVENRNVRPSEVRVLFTKEIEVRFDTQDEPIESASASGSTEAVTLKPGERASAHILENVLAIPDYSLIVNINPDQAFGGNQNPILPMGTWITFHQAINAWNDAANAGGGKVWPMMPKGVNRLEWGFIRKAMVPWQDIWTGMVAAANRFPDALWGARLQSIIPHWRLSYRIPNAWVEGCHSIRPYRVSTTDQETGTRAPSMVYANYTIAHGTRNMWKGVDANKSQEPSVYWKVSDYPDGGEFVVHPDLPNQKMGIIDEDSKVSPCTIALQDEDQGILFCNWLADPLQMMANVVPGHIDEEGLGVFPDLGQDVKQWVSDRGGVARGWNWVKSEAMRVNRMEKGYRMATILTMIPASPNTREQLYEVVVKPDKVKGLLPAAAREGLNDAKGPPVYIRVGPSTATARFAWKDTARHAQVVRNCFGIDGKVEKKEDFEFMDGTLINKGDAGYTHIASPNELRGPDLDTVALAVAAKVYSGFTDKLSGQVDGLLNPEVEIEGYIGSVMHTVNPEGVALSNIQLTEPAVDIDMFAMLDEGTRSQIMKLVQH